MDRIGMRWMAVGLGLVLVLSGGHIAGAQLPRQTHFVGSIATTTPSSAGAWVIGGEWTLEVKGQSGKADFTAALTMGRSDYWVISNGADADHPATRNPHTHHIVFEDGEVSALANGFRVTGIATVTGNGNVAFGGPLPLQVDITGGSSVATSNIALTFGGGAAGHFGPQTIPGVVRGAK